MTSNPSTRVDLRLTDGKLGLRGKRTGTHRDALGRALPRRTRASGTATVLICHHAPKSWSARLSGRFHVTDYASFVAWRDWGHGPTRRSRNVFGSAVVCRATARFSMGAWRRTRSMPGKIYPPGGSLEPDDVRADGRVDVWARSFASSRRRRASMRRRRRMADCFCVPDGPRISVAHVASVSIACLRISPEKSAHYLRIAAR